MEKMGHEYAGKERLLGFVTINHLALLLFIEHFEELLIGIAKY